MRKIRVLIILLLLWSALGLPSSAQSEVGDGGVVRSMATGTKVDPQVWREMVRDPERRVSFLVVMKERTTGEPISAVQAQMGLEFTLKQLKRVGSLSAYSVHYGRNVIRARGTGGVVRFLAAWPEVAAIRADSGELSLVLPPALAARNSSLQATGFSGAVTGPDGITPLEGITVRAYRQIGPIDWKIEGTTTSVTDGTYVFSTLLAGIYRAGFEDPAGDYVTEYYDDRQFFDLGDKFEVTSDNIVPNIDASLAQAGRIAGTLTANQNGDPVKDISASAWITATGEWRVAGSGVSQGDGSYEIDGLAPGVYRVRFSDIYFPARYLDEYYDNVLTIGDATDVSVAAGSTTPNIDAGLGSYGKLNGTVSGPDDITLVEGVFADMWHYDNTFMFWEWISYGETDANGFYEAGGLDTGDYRVEFWDPLGQLAREYYNDKPDIGSGDDVHVELGLTTSGIDASLAQSLLPVTRTYQLELGWNLISPPTAPSDPDPAAALSSISGDYDLVWGYDACDTSDPFDPWKKYAPDDPPITNDLESIDVQHGYWLRTTTSRTLTLTGTLPFSSVFNLCTGWNLIGYPSLKDRPIEEVLAPIDGKYDLVYAYRASDISDPWKKYDPNAPVGNDLKKMVPWLGYWIRMTQAATLTVPGR